MVLASIFIGLGALLMAASLAQLALGLSRLWLMMLLH